MVRITKENVNQTLHSVVTTLRDIDGHLKANPPTFTGPNLVHQQRLPHLGTEMTLAHWGHETEHENLRYGIRLAHSLEPWPDGDHVHARVVVKDGHGNQVTYRAAPENQHTACLFEDHGNLQEIHPDSNEHHTVLRLLRHVKRDAITPGQLQTAEPQGTHDNPKEKKRLAEQRNMRQRANASIPRIAAWLESIT